jgi:hypothetical protein
MLKGDAALSNGRIAVVLRHQAAAVDVHSGERDGTPARMRLRVLTLAGEPATRVERMVIVDNTRAGAFLEATFATAQGARVTSTFRIKRGDVAVQVEPGTGAGKLRVECPGRFAVLPDFFTDDITLDATRLPLDRANLPSENIVLHFIGDGDAIAMCVFESRKEDVQVTLNGQGDRRIITGSEVGFEDKKVWVALLDAPSIWHTRNLEAADTGKIISLDWTMPFPAQWRVDFTRSNDLTDSWVMLLQRKENGKYSKPSWLGDDEDQLDGNRICWNTVLGWFRYPCWSDSAGQVSVQPLKSKKLQIRGPALVYPINRVTQTPLDSFTVVDVMRNTLGVGPCQRILDLEGQKPEYKGRTTCSVRDTLIPIYEKKEQIAKHDKIGQTLDEGLTFVKHIRARIGHYVDFGKTIRQYLAEQKKTHGELSEVIAELDRLAGEVDEQVADRAGKIKTPDDVARMNDDFRRDVLDKDDPAALERCKEYVRALLDIGGNQDVLVGECRWAVKALRQRAGILVVLDPRAAPIASEIRIRAQEALRNPVDHELRCWPQLRVDVLGALRRSPHLSNPDEESRVVALAVQHGERFFHELAEVVSVMRNRLGQSGRH